MPSKFRACAGLLLLSVAASSLSLSAQNAFSPGGPDYSISGGLAGDQTAPHAGLNANGGWVIWQDNGADGDGLGIRAQRLNAAFATTGSPFRVNLAGAGDQERPQIALLANGGAIAVWQGGKFGFQDIFARVINANGTMAGSETRVNTYTNQHQITPAIATLTDGNVIVVWSSFGQDGSLLGVYGQRLDASGAKIGSEFRVNQVTEKNQRTPAVAALADGRFVVTWISELQRSGGTVDVYARVFNANGTAAGNEFAVNPAGSVLCANPAITAAQGGGFAIVWSQRDAPSSSLAAVPSGSSVSINAGGQASGRGWDIFARTYNSSPAATSGAVQLNTVSYGDQYAPRVASFGKSFLATWVSLGQDSAREGIFAQFMNSAGALEGVEFRVNTATASRQMHPALATDGSSRFLVSWTSFQAGTSFEVLGRMYDLIRTEVVPSGSNLLVRWNTHAGSVYQVQVSSDLATWTNFGATRTAAGAVDSITVPAGSEAAYYRVLRLQ